MRKKIIYLSVFVLMAVWLSGLAQAATVSFDFSSGIGTNFTFGSSASPYDFQLNDTSGALQVYRYNLPSFGYGQVYGGWVTSNFTVGGDFDIQVAYTINTSSLASGTQIQLNLPGICMVRSNEGGNNYHVWNGAWQGTNWASDMNGILGFKRTAGLLTAYFNATPIYTTGYGNEDFTFSLGPQANSWSGWNGGNIDVSFDNLSVTADRINGYQPVPVPAAGWLLGSGLLGLLGVRRKSDN